MALQAAYKQFLAAPNPSFLADNASLHYVTTLTSLHGSAAIIKFLGTQSHQLKKKEEKFLDVVESQNAIAAEVFTTIEFETSGSAYLPGLDDNFLADRVVTFPIIHIVQFNADGKIQQIRQNWDQGSLLKLIDVIGKTGRNWPIRDGKDQIKLITSSVTAGGKPVEGSQKQAMPVRSRENSNNVTRDPHASLSLFAPREQTSESSLPAVVAPRASAKPPPRDLNELFVGENGGAPATPARGRSTTSSSSNHSGDKRQHQQNYLPSRLFDNDENSPIRATEDTSKEPRYRPNPAKFKHFDFADPSDAPDAPEPRPNPTSKKSKHGSQWGFEDFQTPAKVVPTKVLVNRTNDVRHWGNSDDEVLDSPVKFKKVDKPRKDAQTHFEFQDDGNSKGEPRLIGRPRGSGQNNGMGLYQNNLYDEENGGSAKGAAPRATSGLANVKDRRKDFDPHFAMTDDSPSTKHVPAPLAEDRAKAVKMMDANWSSYDQSPLQKENFPASPTSPRPTTSNGKGPLSESTNTMSNKGINIAGDGMGSRKVASAAQSPPKQRGISIGGDGMGGKKGAGRSWGFGDDSDGEEAGGLNGVGGKFRNGRPGKAQHQQQSGGDFWDF